MANNPKHSIPTIAVIVGVMSIVVTVTAFAFVFSSPNSKPTPTPTALQPTPVSTNQYQPEMIPPPTDVANPIQTATNVPTNTPVPAPTKIVIPTLLSNSLLPDLTVTSISEPVCAPEYEGTKLRFFIFVRNIGSVSTRTFGTFETDVFLILGQRHYSLEEWETQFDGVVGSSVTDVFNLNFNDDIKFTVVIDLIGNKDFGIEVIANLGDNPIREADTTNNTLIKYFSAACY